METLKKRIQARLDALGISSFEAAARAGQRREFVYDLLAGKKKSIRPSALPALAKALECDVGYLTGAQAAAQPAVVDGGMKLAGFVENGVWREPIAAATAEVVPISPDPRFTADMQEVYLVQNGPHQGAIVTVLVPAPAPLPQGAMVVVRRTREGAAELSLRNVEGEQLTTPGGQSVAVSETHVIGAVIAITHVLDFAR